MQEMMASDFGSYKKAKHFFLLSNFINGKCKSQTLYYTVTVLII